MDKRRAVALSLLLVSARVGNATAQDAEAFARYQAQLNALLLSGGAAPRGAAAASPPVAAKTPCSLFGNDPLHTPSQDCMTCHGLHQTHPVDVDYAAAAQRRAGAFRTADEVVRRGVFLPDGQVKCVTCHDARSPWKYRIALPPGAAAHEAVNLGRPATFEGSSRKWREAAPPPPRGSAVTPTPLCLSCHAYD